MTKADLIRKYHKEFPDLKPTELARKIEAEHKEVKVSVQDVSGTLARGEHPNEYQEDKRITRPSKGAVATRRLGPSISLGVFFFKGGYG
jgi:hypothetical protein